MYEWRLRRSLRAVQVRLPSEVDAGVVHEFAESRCTAGTAERVVKSAGVPGVRVGVWIERLQLTHRVSPGSAKVHCSASITSMNRLIRVAVLVAALCACTGDEPAEGEESVRQVSGDATVQGAFARCVERSRSEVAVNNPHTSEQILEMLYSAADQTCESAVAGTCEQDREGQACRVILDVYGEQMRGRN